MLTKEDLQAIAGLLVPIETRIGIWKAVSIIWKAASTSWKAVSIIWKAALTA